MKSVFSIRESVKTGWSLFKERPWFIMGTVLIIIAASTVTAIAIEQFSGPMKIVANVADFAFQTLIGMGAVFIILAIYDKKEVGYSEWFTPAHLFFKYFAVTLLTSLAVIGGLILFIIPGIMAMVGLMFAQYLVIDKSMGPIDAIKKSWSMSKGHKWKLLIFIGAMVLLNIAGALPLLIGLLVTVPVSVLATIHVYRTLLKTNE